MYVQTREVSQGGQGGQGSQESGSVLGTPETRQMGWISRCRPQKTAVGRPDLVLQAKRRKGRRFPVPPRRRETQSDSQTHGPPRFILGRRAGEVGAALTKLDYARSHLSRGRASPDRSSRTGVPGQEVPAAPRSRLSLFESMPPSIMPLDMASDNSWSKSRAGAVADLSTTASRRQPAYCTNAQQTAVDPPVTRSHGQQ